MYEAARMSSGKSLWRQIGLDRKGQVTWVTQFNAAATKGGAGVRSISALNLRQIVASDCAIVIRKGNYFSGGMFEATISGMT
jgi:hypothetical protein